jgi:hypothetical protein
MNVASSWTKEYGFLRSGSPAQNRPLSFDVASRFQKTTSKVRSSV